MDEDDSKVESEVEADSDHEDQDAERELGNLLGQLEYYRTAGLDSEDTGTVKRRNKTVVTPKMAMESFRFSFLNNDDSPEDVNFDAILGELCELETQLCTTQTELTRNLKSAAGMYSIEKEEDRDSGNDLVQAELDALAAEITQGLGYCHSNRLRQEYLEHYQGETDSAFSENASLPSSESFTSMVTVTDTSSINTVETSSTSSSSTITPDTSHHSEIFDDDYILARLDAYRIHLEKECFSVEEQRARLKAEKIRIALEKIKEAKIRKLFVRAFAKDGSSKSIMVDEKMTVGQVCSMLADKNHIRLTSDLAVVEHLPELHIERVLEDHDSLVENMVLWTRDSKNKILFEDRTEKYDLFKNPEKYLLLGSSSEKGASLDPKQRQKLIEEFFTGNGVQVPEVESVLYIKSDGKKAWKKYFCVLRASGLYFNPKGKVGKSPKDLQCLAQFDFVEIYHGVSWKKKFNAPTDFGFALKHPQIQRKTKHIQYLCAENKASLVMWMMGIRIAKCGKQLYTNYRNVRHEIETWDIRDLPITALPMNGDHEFGSNLQDSRFSVPEPGARHSIVCVKNTSVVRNNTSNEEYDYSDDALCMEVTPVPQRKSSLTPQNTAESPQKTPVKRVSFSATPCIINADSCEELGHVRHRDSITSASTDSSEDSNSSGESRSSGTPRSKLKPKLPVTTGTTRQISEMCQISGSSGIYENVFVEQEEPKQTRTQSSNDRALERRKSAPVFQSADRPVSRIERKGSDSSYTREQRALSQHLYTVPQSPPTERQAVMTSPMSPPPINKPARTSTELTPPSTPIYDSNSFDDSISAESIYSSISPKLTGGVHANLNSPGNTTGLPPPPVPPKPVNQAAGMPEIPSSQSDFNSDIYAQVSKMPSQPIYDQISHSLIQSQQHSKDVYNQVPKRPPSAPPAPLSHLNQNQCSSHPPPVAEKPHIVHTSDGGMPPPPPSVSQVPPPPPPTTTLPSMSKSLEAQARPASAHLRKHSRTGSDTKGPKPIAPPLAPHEITSPVSNCPWSTSETSAVIQRALTSPTPVSSAGGQIKSHHIVQPMAEKSTENTRFTHSRSASNGSRENKQLLAHVRSASSGSQDICRQIKTSNSNVLPADHSPLQNSVNSNGSEMSQALPFLNELSKRSPKGCVTAENHTRCMNEPGHSSTTGVPNTGQAKQPPPVAAKPSQNNCKKAGPPPLPKRSENTKLSSDTSHPLANDNGQLQHLHNIYQNPCDINDVLDDIDALPPPPPELLEGLDSPKPEFPAVTETLPQLPRKPKPPPPPPKRSSNTQLSQH